MFYEIGDGFKVGMFVDGLDGGGNGGAEMDAAFGNNSYFALTDFNYSMSRSTQYLPGASSASFIDYSFSVGAGIVAAGRNLLWDFFGVSASSDPLQSMRDITLMVIDDNGNAVETLFMTDAQLTSAAASNETSNGFGITFGDIVISQALVDTKGVSNKSVEIINTEELRSDSQAKISITSDGGYSGADLSAPGKVFLDMNVVGLVDNEPLGLSKVFALEGGEIYLSSAGGSLSKGVLENGFEPLTFEFDIAGNKQTGLIISAALGLGTSGNALIQGTLDAEMIVVDANSNVTERIDFGAKSSFVGIGLGGDGTLSTSLFYDTAKVTTFEFDSKGVSSKTEVLLGNQEQFVSGGGGSAFEVVENKAFLDITGIEGGVVDALYKGDFTVLGWSLDAQTSLLTSVSGGGGFSSVSYSNLRAALDVTDAELALLRKAMLDDVSIDDVKLKLTENVTSGQDFATIEFDGLSVVSIGHSAGNAAFVEFTYDAMTYTDKEFGDKIGNDAESVFSSGFLGKFSPNASQGAGLSGIEIEKGQLYFLKIGDIFGETASEFDGFEDFLLIEDFNLTMAKETDSKAVTISPLSFTFADDAAAASKILGQISSGSTNSGFELRVGQFFGEDLIVTDSYKGTGKSAFTEMSTGTSGVTAGTLAFEDLTIVSSRISDKGAELEKITSEFDLSNAIFDYQGSQSFASSGETTDAVSFLQIPGVNGTSEADITGAFDFSNWFTLDGVSYGFQITGFPSGVPSLANALSASQTNADLITVNLDIGQPGYAQLINLMANSTAMNDVKLVNLHGYSGDGDTTFDREEITLQGATIQSIADDAQALPQLQFSYSSAVFKVTGDIKGSTTFNTSKSSSLSGDLDEVAFGGNTFKFVTFSGIEGDTLVEGEDFEDAFNLISYDFAFESLFNSTEDSQSIGIAPISLEVNLSAEGVRDLLDRTSNGEQFGFVEFEQGIQISGPVEVYQRMTVKNVSLLSIEHTGGSSYALELGYSILDLDVFDISNIGKISQSDYSIDLKLDDLVTGTDADDTLSGGQGDDTLKGDGGNDEVFGGKGRDVIVGGAGAGDDLYSGGKGRDMVTYTSTSQGIVVDLSAGADHATGVEIDTDQLFGIEDLVLGAGADVGVGTSSSNDIDGWLGSDTLEGLGGKDTLDGGSGKDRLEGGGGGDKLVGGTGGDNLRGGKGADKLNGNKGADILVGNKGRDTLNGGDGADTLNGGESADVLIGGNGPDVFIFDEGFAARDEIVDFDTAVDVIQLDVAGAGGQVIAVSDDGTDTLIVFGTEDAEILLRDVVLDQAALAFEFV